MPRLTDFAGNNIRKGTRVVDLLTKGHGSIFNIVKWDRTYIGVLMDDGRHVTRQAHDLMKES